MLQASKVGMRFDFGLLFWGGGVGDVLMLPERGPSCMHQQGD